MAVINKASACAALAAVLLMAGGAHAASPTAKCEAAKLKIAGKYSLCRLTVQAKEAKQGASRGDFAKCDATFAAKWTNAETKRGASCPSSGDAGRVQGLLSDLATVAGFTTGARFLDNGDGTITDTGTSLMWEKKVRGECSATPSPGFPIACVSDADCIGNGGGGTCLPCLDCVNALYTWSNSGTAPDGTVFTEFLGGLNNCATSIGASLITGGLGGHCDWRLPTADELKGILHPGNLCQAGDCLIDPIFIPTAYDPTSIHRYWSSFAFSDEPTSVLTVDFYEDAEGLDPKSMGNFVRAVRGGL